ncbi:hypothetical protein [Salimicrobium halophilum]|uniref:Uncharacterized protein n=1 Tax=Salimicrobium halophilum TaxID=86666 RepID=A0A1G8WFR1_9BACI|nr:hypothetical protein [Salimicrobium halophilum]SDJ76917.1 hypothetical protein SAMN04490247_3170 [Salimicrobium halophilum]
MKDIEHPEISRVNRTGLNNWKDDNLFGYDAGDNEVFVGDEIYWFDEEEFYLKETLNEAGQLMATRHGGQLKIAGISI